MGQAGYGAEEQATRRARRLAERRAGEERASGVDDALVRRAREDVRRWSAGAEGERAVAAVLAQLDRYGWVALHDVRWPGRPRANLDHVAIGPGGVVVVDAKNWSGDVRVRGDALRQNGYDQSAKVAAVTDAAAAVTALLAPQHRTAVRAVLCLAAQDQPPVVAAGGATVLGRWQLPEHLLALPARLSPYEVVDIARQLDAQLGGGAVPPSMTGAPTPAAKPSRPRSTRRPAAARRPAPARRPARGAPARPARRAGLVIGGALLRLVLLAGVVALAATGGPVLLEQLATRLATPLAPAPSAPAVDPAAPVDPGAPAPAP